ncbi:MAG TPA: TolC family protein [Chryseolinea sp.]|nr:TolC family protein [Chryseolinea sp.]HPM31047.1 TolC family protein [Chryseolinea sp.]
MKAIIRKEMLEVRRKTLDFRHKILGVRRKTLASTCKLSIVFCLVSGVCLSVTSHAQVLRLDSVLSVIKERNPMLQDFRQRANAMNAYSEGATSWMAPEVGGGLWMMPYKKVEEGNGDKGQIMLSVQQKFTHPAKLKASKGYMQSKAAIELAGESVTYNELRAQAKTAYYQWMVLEKKKTVLKENEEIINLMIEIAKIRYLYNQSKLGNIYKAEGRLYEVKNMMLMNENEIHHRITLLNQLMNVPSQTHYEIDTLHSSPSFAPESIDTSLFVSNRSDIRNIDKKIQSMRLNQTLERNQSKPDFNLSFNHMIPRESAMPSQFMLLGMVTIPIAPWSSKMYKSNIKGMDYEIEAMKSERASILNELQGMTIAMVNEIQTLHTQIENYDKHILPALRRNYETTMLAYEENKEELPMVIDAWETLNMTQMQYLDTLQKYYEMIVTYEKQIEK